MRLRPGPAAETARLRDLYSALVPSSAEKRASRLGRRPDSSRGPGGFLPILLVGALLLCHGVFGFAHQISCHGCDPPDFLAGAHPAGHGDDSGHAPGDEAGGGHTSTGYFGIVLSLFGVAVLGLLRGARGWRGASVPRLLHRPRSSPALARLPRGPTLPRLQVFRL